MKKSKSLSLSEKDRNKIIDIIHSKITPLKFKYKKFQNERHFLLNASLPKLNSQNENNSNPIDKRISISTYIEKNSHKSKKEKQKTQSQFRKQVLDTQNLNKEHQFLTKQMNFSCQNFHKLNQRASSTFEKYGNPFPIEKNQKIQSDFLLLQKKKKLKNIKSEIKFKKNKLFDEIQNQQRQKRQEQTLHKKYQQNSRQILRQKFSHKKINSELLSLSNNLDDDKTNNILRNNFQITVQKLQSFSRQNQDPKKISQSLKNVNVKVQQQNKIKEYLRLFKRLDQQRRPQSSNNQLFQSKNLLKKDLLTKNDKLIPYKITQDQDQYSENVNSIFYAKDKQSQRGIYRMLEQKDKNTCQEKDCLGDQIKNAKMRIKFNHRKIVNLGKMQKFSGFAPSNGFDINSI